jgi:hypothetical protein
MEFNQPRGESMKKTVLLISLIFVVVLAAGGQEQIQKPKIFQEEYPLISESDLYCSIYILDGSLPELQIIGAERQDEKVLLSDMDSFYVNMGKADGLDVGQVFLLVQAGPEIQGYGRLVTKRGRGRLIRLEEHRAVLRVERTCSQIEIGNCLLPFEEKEGLLGKDSGYSAFLDENTGISGSFIYLETDLKISGTGQWGIVNLGKDQGIQVGQQLSIFRRLKNDFPREAIGNLVVIDTQQRTSTVKILSCRDTVEVGDQVQTK